MSDTNGKVNTASEPTEAQPQIKLVDSNLATSLELVSVFLRALVVVVSSLGTIMAFVSTRDIIGLVAFFKTTQGAGVVTAAGTIGGLAAMGWRTYVKRRRGMVTAKAAPNHISVVIEKKAA